MLKLVSNKDGVEIHTLQIENGVATIEPEFEGIQELLQGLTDKQQTLNALSGFNPEYVWAVVYDRNTVKPQPTVEYGLSVVNIVPNVHKDAINQIAEAYGCGPNNLSVKLKDGGGKVFWGCHSWWKPEDYAVFSDEELRNQMVPEELKPSLAHLYERLMLDGDAKENWQSALEELNLVTIQEEV